MLALCLNGFLVLVQHLSDISVVYLLLCRCHVVLFLINLLLRFLLCESSTLSGHISHALISCPKLLIGGLVKSLSILIGSFLDLTNLVLSLLTSLHHVAFLSLLSLPLSLLAVLNELLVPFLLLLVHGLELVL